MELTKEQDARISECFPKQRKPAKISNLEVLNAVLYVVENGCKWRRLPKEYVDWHVSYVRENRWAKKGVLQKSPAFRCISAVPRGQRKAHPISIRCGDHMKFSVPSAPGSSDGLRTVFSRHPCRLDAL